MAHFIKFEKENCMPCKFSDQFIQNEIGKFDYVKIQEVSELKNDSTIHTIDIIESTDLVEKFDIQSVPTFVLWDGEKILKKVVGFNPDKLKDLLAV